MTQEERTLLHIDLSERVPYDTVLRVRGLVTSNEEFGDAYLDTVSWYEEVSVRDGSRVSYDIADVRPYLRPLSSMTEEEKYQYEKTQWEYQADYCAPKYFDGLESYDWLNAHFFDFRGLIEKGLALEATEGLYNS